MVQLQSEFGFAMKEALERIEGAVCEGRLSYVCDRPSVHSAIHWHVTDLQTVHAESFKGP